MPATAALMPEVIVPVFFTVALGYLYARRHKPDMKTFNQIALDAFGRYSEKIANDSNNDTDNDNA